MSTETMPDTTTHQTAAKSLMSDWAAIRLGFGRMGTRVTFTAGQKEAAAAPFGADAGYLSARKKLLDTRAPAFLAVTGVLAKAKAIWEDATLPYPEPGVRLAKQTEIAGIVAKLEACKPELAAAVGVLEEKYDTLKATSMERLGTLYNPDDFPPTLAGLFSIEIDLPSLKPPAYLQADPKLYAEQSARCAARYDYAVTLWEQAAIGELSDMLNHLSSKLSGIEDGTAKRLHSTAVENLREFFEKFKNGVHSSTELDSLVAKAEAIINTASNGIAAPITAEDLKDSATLRATVREKLAGVTASLDRMVSAMPKRMIVHRQPQPQKQEGQA